MNHYFMTLGCISFLGLVGCDNRTYEMSTPGTVTTDDIRRDANRAVETAAEWSIQTRDSFQKDLEVRLQDIDEQMVKLRKKGADLQESAKVKWDKNMVEFKSKRDAAQAKLNEVGKSSAEAWKDVQKGAQAAWEDLDKSFRNATAEF